MRLIGHLKDDVSAKLFGDYLSGLEIGNRIEPDSDGTWAVWVYSEEQLDLGRQWLAKFQANPKDPCFAQTAAKAAEVKDRENEEARAYQERVRTPATIWRQPGFGVLTLSLILVCVVAALFSGFSGTAENLNPLRISVVEPFLQEVRAGQIWRLITPIFIHFGPLHLLFNMLWLKDLGSVIEYREGSGKLALLVVIVALLSNLGQYVVSGPWFGGMSGVIFGLFGYVWIRGRFDPRSGYWMNPANVALMLVWFVVCALGWVGSIANTCHGVGLVTGMAWGWVNSQRRG